MTRKIIISMSPRGQPALFPMKFFLDIQNISLDYHIPLRRQRMTAQLVDEEWRPYTYHLFSQLVLGGQYQGNTLVGLRSTKRDVAIQTTPTRINHSMIFWGLQRCYSSGFSFIKHQEVQRLVLSTTNLHTLCIECATVFLRYQIHLDCSSYCHGGR